MHGMLTAFGTKFLILNTTGMQALVLCGSVVAHLAFGALKDDTISHETPQSVKSQSPRPDLNR
jgi:hypothetical protein